MVIKVMRHVDQLEMSARQSFHSSNRASAEISIYSKRENCHNRFGQNISIGKHRFETSKLHLRSDLRRRIMLASRCLYGLNEMFQNHIQELYNQYYLMKVENNHPQQGELCCTHWFLMNLVYLKERLANTFLSK